MSKRVANVKPSNYKIVVDRIESLISRWNKFYDEHGNLPDLDKQCIKGLFNEVNDGFCDCLLSNETKLVCNTESCISSVRGECVLNHDKCSDRTVISDRCTDSNCCMYNECCKMKSVCPYK